VRRKLTRETIMSDAAPQAAENKTCGQHELELAALRWGWGEAYRISREDETGCRARRRDDLGGHITAGTADELWSAILADYTFKPVPRATALPAGPGGDDLPPGTVLRDSDDDEPS
jgi:hypothetical protein